MKLSKKDSLPVLTFDITNLSRSQKQVALRHDVPCTVLPKDTANEIRQPRVGIADMKINLPNLENLRKCIDRLKQIDHDLILRANLAGVLELVVEAEGVRVTKGYKDLAPDIQRQPQEYAISDQANNHFIDFIDGNLNFN